MNPIAVGLIIGGVIGFGIGLTLAPDVALSSMTEEQQELLCLEERSQLMGEVRQALEKMQAANCQPATPDDQPVPALEAAPGDPPIQPPAEAAPGATVDAGAPAAASLVDGEAQRAQDAGSAPQAPAESAPKSAKASTAPSEARPAAPAQKPGAVASRAEGWMVQLVASPDPAEAGKVERRARALGLNTRVVLEEVPDQSRSLYKVRVGPFADKAGGVEALRRVKRELKITGWLHRAD